MKENTWKVFFRKGDVSFSLNVHLKLKSRPFGPCEKCGLNLPGMIINISVIDMYNVEATNKSSGDIKPMSKEYPMVQRAVEITQEMFRHDHKYCFEHLDLAINKIIIQARKYDKPIILP